MLAISGAQFRIAVFRQKTATLVFLHNA